MKYRMLGVDLDGTLLDSRGRLSARNLAALKRAQDAGLLVVPCTGRAWRESHRALAEAAHLELGVFVTGAAISEMATGRTLDMALIEPSLAMRIVVMLREFPEAVLVCRAADRVGHDYLVTGQGALTDNTAWWFKSNGIRVHHQPDIELEDLDHTMRVGMVAAESRMIDLVPRLRGALGEQILAHSFPGVQAPDPAMNMHILEVFAQGVDKWRGLKWVAGQHGIEPDEIAVIGDEINDLPMLIESSCAIAMGNAIEPIREAARYITLTNDEDGVAHAIGRLIAEKWG